MANTVEIIIKAIDQASGNINKATSGLDKFKAGFQSLTGISLSAAGGIAAAGMAINKIVDFTKQAVNETVNYVSSIRDMSRLLGLSTEETSRLVQASDDLFLSQESLTTAMLAASRKGIDTSITGLKGLSEQYLALNPGVERAKFLMDNFGRSGAEMGKLMEVGAAGIDAAMASIQDSLVVTNASVINIENYKRSVDLLTDSWTGFKLTVGNAVIPALDLLFRTLTKGTDDVENYYHQVNKIENQISKLSGPAAMGSEAAKERIEELRIELTNLKNVFYGIDESTSGAVSAFAALGESTIPTSAYLQELTTALIYNQAAAGLDEESALKLAEAMGLVSPNTAQALGEIQRFRENLADTGNLDKYINRVSELADQNDRLHGGIIDWQINVGTNYPGGLSAWVANQGWYGNTNPNLLPGRAGGGPVWSNTPYVVGEKGPEVFVPNQSGTIIPNGVTPGNNVNFYGDAYFTVQTPELANDVVKQMRIDA